jgi:D-sedoheptulose 7-phosphate isomerase
MKQHYYAYLEEHRTLFSDLHHIAPEIINAGNLMLNTLRKGNKLLLCGNGGSAADAQHFAAELVGRFERERQALPAFALTTDSSILTALGNDYGFNTIFSRQVEALGIAGDTVLGISTSGNSENVVLAMHTAKDKGINRVGLLGCDGGRLASCVDIAVIVPHAVTARIQEAHGFLIHFWAAIIEAELFSAKR